jgi:hypothetical protein
MLKRVKSEELKERGHVEGAEAEWILPKPGHKLTETIFRSLSMYHIFAAKTSYGRFVPRILISLPILITMNNDEIAKHGG